MKIALCLNNISIFRQTYSFSLPFVTKEGGAGQRRRSLYPLFFFNSCVLSKNSHKKLKIM